MASAEHDNNTPRPGRRQTAGPVARVPHNVAVTTVPGPAPAVRGTGETVLAAVLVLGSIACVVATGLLELRIADADVQGSLGPALDTSGFFGLVGLAMVGCALVVLRQTAYRAFGWTLAGVGLFWLLDGLSQSYVRLGVATDDQLAGMTFAVWFLYRFTSLLPLTIVILPLLFPDGRFVPGAGRVAGWVTVAVMALSSLAYLVVPSTDASVQLAYPPGVDRDPTTVEALAPVVSPSSTASRSPRSCSACWCRSGRSSRATAAPSAWTATGCAGCSGACSCPRCWWWPRCSCRSRRSPMPRSSWSSCSCRSR